MLAAGNPFPNFSLPNQDGKITTLSDFAGNWAVIYFYPKDDTPDFDAAGIKVVGVSADDVTSHQNFSHKFAFKIDLLSDTDSGLMKSLGIGQSEWKGMKFWDRTTFVVDSKGIIRKVYEKVNPEGHEKVLLDDIAGLKEKAA
jgi:peroxiredoxin Q/BCP